MMISKDIYNSDSLGYYEILQVSVGADDETIKQNYRELAKKWHPDHNSDENALEIFQKISVAYDVLKDEHKRLIYDMLCLAYPLGKMPDMFTLKVYKNQKGDEDVNIRALNITQVVGKVIKSDKKEKKEICSYQEALKFELLASVKNWLFGWWSPKAFGQNLDALYKNFSGVNKNKQDNLTLLVHNAIAYFQENKLEAAIQSAVLASQYANLSQKLILKKFLDSTPRLKQQKSKAWNFAALRMVQLLIPIALVVGLLAPTSSKFVTEADLMSYFAKKKEMEYYQEVRFNNRGSISDDVVVAKVLNIPVDSGDMSKIYHLKQDTDVMYGPSDSFDVLKKLSANTSVRLTGITPDEIWYRIMLDNGDMGFVRATTLSKGKGRDIPYDSKIYQR